MVKKRNISKRKAAVDTADRLIRTFVELSGEVGVARITLQQVARRAKIPFPTAHHHFGNGKAYILAEAIRYVGGEAQEFIGRWVERAGLENKNSLEAYFLGSFEWARQFPAMAGLWIYNYHILSFHREQRIHHAEIIAVAQNRILRLLREGVGSGHISSGAATAENAYGIHTTLIGSMILAITDADSESFSTHSKRGWAHILLMLRQNSDDV